MSLDINYLEEVMETADLPTDVLRVIQELLNAANAKGGDLAAVLEDLPPEMLAKIMTMVEPASGEPVPPASHGRIQDAESFEFENTDIKTGENQGEGDGFGFGSDFSFTGPLQGVEIFFQNFSNPQQNSEQQSTIRFSSIQDNDPLIEVGDSLPEFRSFDASGNNLTNLSYGASYQPFMSVCGYHYHDGMAEPNDANRPNVREVSNEIFAQTGDIFNEHGLSNFFWVWGQFLDHDINLTQEGHGEAYDILVPTGDPYFDPYSTGTQVIHFTRSGYMDGTGENVDNPRLQMNEITAFIDASNVYGSTEEVAMSLRAEGGKLLMGGGDLMPMGMGERGPEFKAGDVRASENVGLSSMHTIFAREHNFQVDRLKAENPDYTDDELYQMAKMIVEAEMQQITYGEFLPLLLGKDALDDYEGYNSTIDPQIATEFATAAFRFGHTMLSSDIFRYQENGDDSTYGHLSLQEAFFNPNIILTEGGVDDILRGLGSSQAQNIDAKIIGDVRNFLFGPPGAGGFDLVSLNIQRGRDHGLPSFNEVREGYGLEAMDSFADLTSDADLIAKLTQLYGDIDHLDLWVGGLIEAPYADGVIGETFHVIIADQFTRIRDGDRFWFEERLDDDLLELVRSTSLSDIIQRNSDITHLQESVFAAKNRIGGDDTDNVINGTDDADLLIGFDGNDTLNGGAGADELFGDGGQDTFIFDVIDGELDVIHDFSIEDDIIDISQLLENYDPLTEMISDFVSFVQDGLDSILSIDADGGADGFQEVVKLSDFTLEGGLEALLVDNHLVVN